MCCWRNGKVVFWLSVLVILSCSVRTPAGACAHISATLRLTGVSMRSRTIRRCLACSWQRFPGGAEALEEVWELLFLLSYVSRRGALSCTFTTRRRRTSIAGLSSLPHGSIDQTLLGTGTTGAAPLACSATTALAALLRLSSNSSPSSQGRIDGRCASLHAHLETSVQLAQFGALPRAEVRLKG